MTPAFRRCTFILVAKVSAALLAAVSAEAQSAPPQSAQAPLANETPAQLKVADGT